MLFSFVCYQPANAFEILGDDLLENYNFYNWEKDEQITILSNNSFSSWPASWVGLWIDFLSIGTEYQITIAGNVSGSEHIVQFQNDSNVIYNTGYTTTTFEKIAYFTADTSRLKILIPATTGVATISITELEIRSVENVEFNLNITSSSIAGIMNYSNDMFGSIWELIALIIGLPLAFWFLYQIIGIVKTKRK